MITFLTQICCFRICSRLLCTTPSSLCHFRLKGPNRADIEQLAVAHAHTLPMETPSGSRDITSGRHIGDAQFCCFCLFLFDGMYYVCR
jgi:hypothetical protein